MKRLQDLTQLSSISFAGLKLILKWMHFVFHKSKLYAIKSNNKCTNLMLWERFRKRVCHAENILLKTYYCLHNMQMVVILKNLNWMLKYFGVLLLKASLRMLNLNIFNVALHACIKVLSEDQIFSYKSVNF